MLVAGDFNSIPGSAAHSLLVKGRVEPPQLVCRLSTCLTEHITLQLSALTASQHCCSTGFRQSLLSASVATCHALVMLTSQTSTTAMSAGNDKVMPGQGRATALVFIQACLRWHGPHSC
jgi:hypothetical protein